jgi:twitching motility protein PilT
VGISCQRLDYLEAHGLRVPRCEMLLPSSGARGTIRAGNFSQIPNVLQSGGDEGMWTFDRYQRWMSQMSDWDKSSPDAVPYSVGATPGGLPPRLAKPAPAPASAAPPRTAPRSTAQTRTAPGEYVIEVPAEDMNLAQLAELAKKVVERKPP